MAQPRNRRGGEPEGGGRGRQRSRANPFKSTQLRQWGFICYLGGHIVSRRERTDRLRRASDGLARREPRSFPSRSWGSKRGTTFIGPAPLYFTTVSTSSRTSYQSRQLRRHPPEKRIRRYTSLPPNFPPPPSTSLSPPLLEDTVYSGMGRVSRLDFLNFFFHRFLSLLLLLFHSRWKNGFFLGEEKGNVS